MEAGIRPPRASVLRGGGANGRLGFVVSDGTDRPVRVRAARLHEPGGRHPAMIEGEMVADIIPTFGSVNMIGGELDR
jgi:NADH-quinone oxidoreductase subunit D